MDEVTSYTTKAYSRPVVLKHQPLRFETAQSWNKGVGNKNPSSNGNGGVNYPNDPRPGKKPHK
ncbi:hypothetical protein [Paenibacillus cremeus]|uniref:Uncharacterized protein n=1 Tax=Paenibacillus cremeus TaxID=2163881 RepID=A0A559K0E1_9BACL|nr:hypothetical protein [Paenibacillus cremeus]TVY05619.1 hypothetical protein FPZ49_29010 [Paenibacillus cremeus]